jgi:heterodisulfide reductase subunit C
MDYGPDRVIRLVELGERERVLNSPDIWLCASCETCAARCPNDIDVAAMMDTLRHIALADGVRVPDQRIIAFHNTFLNVVKMFGRSHEASFLALYAPRNVGLVMASINSGLKMFLSGKLPLIPSRIKGAGDVKALYEAAQQADASLRSDVAEG